MDPLESFKAFVSNEIAAAKDEIRRLATIDALEALLAVNGQVSEIIQEKIQELKKQ